MVLGMLESSDQEQVVMTTECESGTGCDSYIE
jgi:hypothetical protein